MALDQSGKFALLILVFLSYLSTAFADDKEKSSNNKIQKISARQVFDLLDFQIDGNTQLSQRDLENALYPFLGSERSMSDIDAARKSLENFYHAAGYLTVYVDVPPQELKDGRVRLQVTEGYIERLRVSGSQYHSQQKIIEQVTEVQPGKVPDFNLMQKELGQINLNNDLQVVPVLREGKILGSVDAELKVQDQLPLHGSVELSDRYSQNTPHARINSGIHYDNLWQQGHSIGLNFTTAPGHSDQTTVWHASYVMPWNDASIALYALHSDSAASTVGDISVLGVGTVFGVRWNSHGISQGNWTHTLSVGLDYKSFEQTVNLSAGSSTSGYKTPIHYLPWQLQWHARGLTEDGVQNNIGLAANFSLRGLGNDDFQFENNRYKALASYLYIRGDLETIFPIGHSRLIFRGGSQWSSQPLISNDQYAIGGAESVRGYTEAARIGDRGLNGSLEWQSASIKLPLWLIGSGGSDLRWLAFYDWARASILEPLPSQTTHFRLASLGLGFRLQVKRHLSTFFDIARPLLPDSDGHQQIRLHSRLVMEF